MPLALERTFGHKRFHNVVNARAPDHTERRSNTNDASKQLEALLDLEGRVARWNTARAEDLDAAQVWAETIPPGRVLVQKCAAIFAAVLETFSDDDLDGDLELLGDAPDESRTKSPFQQAGNAAFVARMECHQLLRQLSELSDKSTVWVILDTAQRTRRRLLRSVTVVGKLIAAGLGRRASTSPNRAGFGEGFTEEIARSLRCRRSLATLWRRMRASANPDQRAHLRRLGTAIASHVGSQGYAEMRIPDRRILRQLQERIITSLREETTPEQTTRLLQEVASFESMTRRISNRMELREHDQWLVSHVIDDLPRNHAEFVGRCQWLAGLSEGLDLCLFSKVPTDPVDFTRELHAVARRLGSRGVGTTSEYKRAIGLADADTSTK